MARSRKASQKKRRPAGESGRDVPAWIVAALLSALVLIFLNRAFHIDDPLFIWAAKHIQADPANPYGFVVNWYGRGMAMSEVTKNPPLASYYIAVVAALFGWSEPALHLAFLLPALAVAGGTYVLAKRFCTRPALATLVALITPVFFVSSLTVMCDVFMLACWVWAVHLWSIGLGETRDDTNHVALGVAAALIAAAALSKYFGMTLIPLLAVYSLLKTRRIGWWVVYVSIPVAVLAWYQHATHALYGRGLLLDAAAFATAYRAAPASSPPNQISMARLWVTLAFTGGCVATSLCFAYRLWSRAVLYAGLGLVGASTLAIAVSPALGSFQFPGEGMAHLLIALQLGVWGTAGIGLLMLAGLDVLQRRDADSWLLLLWTIGTFVFAGFVNWSINARSILPLVIPSGMLIVRRMERRAAPTGVHWLTPGCVVPLAAALMLSVAVTWADTAFADTARAGAQEIHRKYPADGRTVWFQSHWGFQYYMEQLGAKAIDDQQSHPARGDLVVVPSTAANIFPMSRYAWARPIDAIDMPSPWLSTMSQDVGAGFYADVFGPLPFALGRVAPERFSVYEVRPELGAGPPTSRSPR